MKKFNLAALTLALGGALTLISTSAAGSGGTIKFTGSVVAGTCVPTVTGSYVTATGTDATVKLDPVQANDLAGLGKTGGTAHFNIVLSGCTPVSGRKVTTYFMDGTTALAGQSVLKNTATTGGATKVGLQLRYVDSASGKDAPVSFGDGSEDYASHQAIPAASTTSLIFPFSVSYYNTTATTPTAGDVTSKADYTITYP